MTDIEVVCAAAADGWLCTVRVREDRDVTDHEVTLRPADTDAHGVRGVGQAERLVRETFAFLLEREPKESILTRFDLSVVERYFPDYPHAIRTRLSR